MAALQINSLFLKTYVTAVRFYKDNYVFSAIGGNLNIYQLNNDIKKKLQVEIFPGQSIHGIVFNTKDECLVYGGKLICLLKVNILKDELSVNIIQTFSINDWILKAKFCQENILLVTAHNNAILLCSKTGQNINFFTSDEKCILYSAEIVIDENEEINDNVVLGGTVFSEIIIWRTKYVFESNKILHRLQGHKGVIFSIAFSNKLQKITSTSDDRSLRIWNIKEKTKIDNNKINWENVDIFLLQTAYGHMDRVRSSCIVEKQELIISIGEDSMICIWSLNGNLLSKKSSHQSAPIWDLDVNIKKQLIMTGGGDGGVLLHKIIAEEQKLQQLPLDITGNTLLKYKFCPKKVFFTSKSTLLSISQEGFLLKFCSKTSYWNLIDHMTEMFSYCVEDNQFNKIVVCGLNGCIRVYEETNNGFKILIKKSLFDERIVSVIIAQNENILLCTESGMIFIYALLGKNLEKIKTFKVPLTSEPWFTAANIWQNYVIVGDRKGNIHLYDNELLPINTLYKVHCHLGVTSITVKNDIIISTGRDSKCVNFKIHLKKLVKLSCNKIDFKWIDRCIFVKDVLLLCGFMSNKFMICTIDEIIWQINCGGGHRSWDLCIFNDTVNIVFVKNSEVCRTSIKISDILIKPVEESFLNKEINCLTSIFSDNKNSIFISGGEDTNLTICAYDKDKNKIRKCLTIHTHLSSIKDVKIIKCESNNKILSFLVISCGSRAQICISKIKIDLSYDKPIFETELLAEHMLNCFDDMKKNKDNEELFQDMRYMNLSIAPYNINENVTRLLMIAGCSDGYMRVLHINKKNDNLNIKLISSIFNGKCILQTHIIKCTKNNSFIIITMDTEGMLKLWSFSQNSNEYKLQVISSQKLHENGINSYDVKPLTDETFLLSTGGDDNAVKLTLLNINHISNSINLLKTVWESKSTHCAQITGIRLLSKFIIIISIDQRISLFEWNLLNDDKVECKFIDQRLTTVADIQGIEIINQNGDNTFMGIYGRGVNILEFKAVDKSNI